MSAAPSHSYTAAAGRAGGRQVGAEGLCSSLNRLRHFVEAGDCAGVEGPLTLKVPHATFSSHFLRNNIFSSCVAARAASASVALMPRLLYLTPVSAVFYDATKAGEC